MIYEKRNVENLNKLGPNTKLAAFKWYEQLEKEKIEVLIYETVRTIEKQKENIKKGVSQTMKSYHLVSQAIDWVLVNSEGKAMWDSYESIKGKRVIEIAKSFSFQSGCEWERFKDCPHLEYKYKGYGTDIVVKPFVKFIEVLHEGDKGEGVKHIQKALKLKADGIFGPLTTKAVIEFQKKNKLKADGIVGPNTHNKLFN